MRWTGNGLISAVTRLDRTKVNQSADLEGKAGVCGVGLQCDLVKDPPLATPEGSTKWRGDRRGKTLPMI